MDKTYIVGCGIFVPSLLTIVFNLSFIVKVFAIIGTTVAYGLFLKRFDDQKVITAKQTNLYIIGMTCLLLGPCLLHEIRFDEFSYEIIWSLSLALISAAGVILMVFSEIYDTKRRKSNH